MFKASVVALYSEKPGEKLSTDRLRRVQSQKDNDMSSAPVIELTPKDVGLYSDIAYTPADAKKFLFHCKSEPDCATGERKN